ncbi:hypothetical protein [Nocardioides iriomotensis]|uniref:Uncharacterized protein n=1 Tax=Nocardioides iriomotensis TaxID=715784 RepID=A0A4Q5J890_9ACTN|nr:hypothetical protein [Nocardioides iriomotensis]RYU14814.1 hypothetical protein ETU37_02160 [Nocardioides iriomotensis]
MAQPRVRLTVDVRLKQGVQAAQAVGVAIELNYVAHIEAAGGGNGGEDQVRAVTRTGGAETSTISSTVRGELDANGRGSIIVEDAAPGSAAALNVLDRTGRVAASKPVGTPTADGSILVDLDANDLAAATSSLPQPAAGPDTMERVGVFAATSDLAYPFSLATLVLAPVKDAATWSALGLDKLFQSNTARTTTIVWVNTDQTQAPAAAAWEGATVGVDGRFRHRFMSETTSGWLWWLIGTRGAIGFVTDDLSKPLRTPLIVTLPVFPEPATTSGTDTVTAPGRTPTATDDAELADNPQVFTEDPGEYCRPFSNPERILSERAFFTILRTEQPAIGAEGTVRTGALPVVDVIHPVAVPPRPRNPRGPRGIVSRIARVATSARSRLSALPEPSLLSTLTPEFGIHSLPKPYLDFLSKFSRGRSALDGDHPLDWEGDAARYQAVTVARGHIIEFRVRWRSNGYSLGNVAKTLTLTPRQVKRIQKIEWERLERSRRTEVTEVTERVSDATSRERDYENAVRGSLSEWARGESHSDVTAAAGGAGFALPGFVIGGGAAHSNASSSSEQQGGRRTSASEEQRLRDSIRRFGDSLRRQESTVVNEVAQEETVTGTTEVVRNPNYAHSLTVIYHQILRHLKVTTEFAAVRECVFVPLAVKPFTIPRAYRWRDTLATGLQDRRLQPALDNLGDVFTGFAYSSIVAGRRSDQPVRHVHGSLYVDLAVERPKDKEDDKFDDEAWAVLRVFLPLPAIAIHARLLEQARAVRDRLFQTEHAPGIAANWANTLTLKVGNQPLFADFTLASRYSFNRTVRIDFSAPIPPGTTLTRESLATLRVDATQGLTPGSVANLVRISFTYQTDTFERTVAVQQGALDLIQPLTGAVDASGATVSAPPTAWERVDLRAQITRSVQELVQHLNEHREYYHKLIWWTMDRDLLYMMLDGYYVPGTNGVSLASVVEREPIAIMGNALVYRVSAGSFLGMPGVDTPANLHNYYAQQQAVSEPLYLSLPTDGLYAQTVMDECEALEEHYGSTDWVLADPDPALADLPPELLTSRRAEPQGTTPTAFPATLINLQNAPEAPAPAGLSEVLGALTNANAFRDMAGLAGTQANARAGLETAASLATTFGNKAAELKLAELAAQEHATKTADQKLASIDRAKQKQLVTPEQATEQAQHVLEEMHTTPRPTRPHQEEAIVDAIHAARMQPGSTIEASTAEGEVRVAFGDGEPLDEAAGPAFGDADIILASGGGGRKPVEHIIVAGGPSNFYNGFGKDIETPAGSGSFTFTLNTAPTNIAGVAAFCNPNQGNITHDLYWANFIESIPRLYSNKIARLADGDILTILVYYPPYAARSERDWAASPWNTMKWLGSPWVANKDPYDPMVRRTEQGNIPVIARPTPASAPKRPSTAFVSQAVNEERIDHEILMRTTTEALRPGQTYEARPHDPDMWLTRLHDLPRLIVHGKTLGGPAKVPNVLVKLLMVTDPGQILSYLTLGQFTGEHWRHLLDKHDEEDMGGGGPTATDRTGTWYDWYTRMPSRKAPSQWQMPQIDRAQVKVKRLDYFGHSNDDSWFLQYGWENKKGDANEPAGEVVITTADLDAALSAAPSAVFSANGKAHLWGCSLGLAMAPTLRKYVDVEASEELTDYESLVLNPINMPTPVAGGWKQYAKPPTPVRI